MERAISVSSVQGQGAGGGVRAGSRRASWSGTKNCSPKVSPTDRPSSESAARSRGVEGAEAMGDGLSRPLKTTGAAASKGSRAGMQARGSSVDYWPELTFQVAPE
jgi:hypothetical protein